MAEQLPDEEMLIKYLDEEMSPVEKAAFERVLIADATLRERLNEMMLLKNAVLHQGTRESVAGVRKAFEQSKQPAKILPMKNIVRYGAVAASIIIIVVAAKLFIWNSPSAEKIYEETYVSYTLDNTRSAADSLSAIETAYRDKNYAEVIALGKQKRIPLKEQLLLGISYLETNDLPSSINLFQGLREQTMEPYHLDADFYLGLAYIKNKDYPNALGVFQKIQGEPGHPYHAQVTEKVIEEIRGLKE